MSVLESYFADKLTEYTDEYTAVRLQNAVHSLGVEAVWRAKEDVEAESQFLAGLTNSEKADFLGLGSDNDEDETRSIGDELDTAIFDFDDLARHIIGKIGNYWVSSIEPNELFLKSEHNTASRIADDIVNTTLRLTKDEDGKPVLTKTDHLGRSRSEASIENSDIQAMGLALRKLHEASQQLAPEEL